MNRAIVGIGSNIDPEKNIQKALARIEEAFTLLDQSKTVQTAPVGFQNQPHFLNSAVLIETALEKDEFVKKLKAIESDLGRKRGENRDGPRTIDLDLVVWNGEIVDPDFYERSFLRNAVLELDPGLK